MEHKKRGYSFFVSVSRVKRERISVIVEALKCLTTVLKSTTVIVLVMKMAFPLSWVWPALVNCMSKCNGVRSLHIRQIYTLSIN